jgi:LDH2 family malate/lactate/ureidoglycolate dehydrogenase
MRPRIIAETPVSVVLDGGNTTGYVTSVLAIDAAIERANAMGVGLATVHNTWFSGRCSYYVERAARAGFVALHTANTSARVAPFGGIDRVYGTNPVAVAVPRAAPHDPIVVDFSTAATTWGEVLLHLHTRRKLPEGWAVDRDGRNTSDPQEALDGAFLPWGQHRGSGLALVAQLLGVLAGSCPVVEEAGGSGFFFLVFDPKLLGSDTSYLQRVEGVAAAVTGARPQNVDAPVRLPGERSAARRRAARAEGWLELDDEVYRKLLDLAATG